MSSDGSEGYAFVCTNCEECLEVNKKMKDTLIERGCVICGNLVTEEAFPEDSFADSS